MQNKYWRQIEKYDRKIEYTTKYIFRERGVTIEDEKKKESSFMHEGEKKSEDDTLFLTYSVKEIAHDEVWYIDSGCSNHMTENKVFVDLDESITSEVRTGDDKRIFEKGKGNILVQTKKGSSVFYVPRLKHNLLSIGQLLLRGFHVYFNEDMCEIKDKHDTLITKVKLAQSKMFPLKLNSQIDSCMHTTIQDKS